MVEALRQQNENLQDNFQTLQTQTGCDNDFKEEPRDLQPLAEVVWEGVVLKNFKPPPLTSFDGKSDPRENIIFINSQMAIVRASNP